MSKDEYLITATPLKALTVFAMPMILGSLFQQIYNMADSIIAVSYTHLDVYKRQLTYHRITNSNFRYCSTRQSRS